MLGRMLTWTRAKWPPRPVVVDLVIVAAVAAMIILCSATPTPTPIEPNPLGTAPTLANPRPDPLADPLAIAAIVVACAALMLRRRFPVSVAITTLAASAIYYPFALADGPIMVAFVVAIYTVSASGRLVSAILVTATGLVLLVCGEIFSSTRHVDNFALFLVVGWFVAVVAVGAVVNSRRAYLAEARQRELAAQRVRVEELRHRATEERLHIARELHDVLGHQISLINVQSGAALHRLSADPEQAGPALVAIKEASGQALRDLRATLGMLRQVDEDAPVAPTPSLDRLDELVRRAESAGLAVRTEISGDRSAVPSDVDVAGFRIIQEALTNAARHGRANNALLTIEYSRQLVRITVTDDGIGATSGGTDGGDCGDGGIEPGNGITGMRERASALGGDLTVKSGRDGGVTVRANLPSPEPIPLLPSAGVAS